MASFANDPQRPGSVVSADLVKTCEFLGHGDPALPRRIVAGCYLPCGRVAFVDRGNCQLLVANVHDDTLVTFDLTSPVSEDGRSDAGSPSDVNRGFTQNELLVTFTHEDSSTVARYQLSGRTLYATSRIYVPSRSRSAVALDDRHIAVTSPEYVHVIGIDGVTLDSKSRQKRDRGGLLMADRREGRFYYGDGNDFVCCRWLEGAIHEVFRFRHPGMKFPRGSALDNSGRILVCCDASCNVFRVDPGGRSSDILIKGDRKRYGDVDFFEGRMEFFTTFWSNSEWPLIFRLTGSVPRS